MSSGMRTNVGLFTIFNIRGMKMICLVNEVPLCIVLEAKRLGGAPKKAKTYTKLNCDVNAADLKALVDETCCHVINFSHACCCEHVSSRDLGNKHHSASSETRLVAGSFGF